MKPFKILTFFFVVLVIAFTPLDAIEISEGEGVTLGRYLFIGMTLCAIPGGYLSLKRPIKIFKILVVFTIWAFLTSIWSIDFDVSIVRTLYLIQYSIIFIVMVNALNSKERVRLAMIGWILGSVYIAYLTATDFSQFSMRTDDLYRVSKFGNPNENSFMLCFALLLCYLIDKTRFHIPSILISVFAAFAIVANGSRMGVLLYLLCIVGACFQFWQGKKRLYVLLLIPLAISLGSYILNNLPEASIMRIMNISDNLENREFANREDIWQSAFVALDENPVWYLFGSGWGTFAVGIQTIFGKAIGAHNFYLDLLFTTGIVGLSIVLYYLYSLFGLIRHTYKANFINYLMLAVPLISMMSTNWQSRRWWFLLGAFIYLTYKYKNFTIDDVKR